MNWKKIVSFLIASLLASTAIAGQFSIYGENDFFYDADYFFTHGTRLQYTGDDNLGYAVGQNMYTPRNRTAKELVPDDRPYSGYLYGSVFDTFYLENEDEFFIELQMGITGPPSLAGQTQAFVHKLLDNKIPQGWDNQIATHFEFVIIDRYTTHIYESKYFAIDPFIGTYLGTLQDSFNAGCNVYAGYNLPSDRNQQRVIPFKGIRGIKEWSSYAYMFVGFEPKIVWRNALLEDDRFTIHPNRSVYDRNIGFVVGCKYTELAFTLCERSKEFEEQSKPEKFGAIKLSFNF